MALIFPKSTDKYVRIGALVVGALVLGGAAFALYVGHPEVQRTGYMPAQPVPYSHKLHAGNMGMDCYYCHNTVFKAGLPRFRPRRPA